MSRKKPDDEARQTRDLLLLTLALLGLLVGVFFSYTLQAGQLQSARWIDFSLTLAAAVSALLGADLLAQIWRRRLWALVLLKLAMFALNVILLVAELMIKLVLVSATGS